MIKKNTFGRPQGVITVFLTLSLLIILSLITTVIASARDRSMRMRTEICMDMAMQSVFAEYNRELLGKYDLYFIDCSYGNEQGDVYYTNEHFKDYMSYNLSPQKGEALCFSKDMFGLNLDNSDILLQSLATDDNALVYKRQAIQAAKDKYGLGILEDITKMKKAYDGSGIDNCDVRAEREKYTKKMEKAKHAKDKEGHKLHYKNPVKDIENARSSILNDLLKKEALSNKAVDNSILADSRMLSVGDGIVACNEDLSSLTSNLLFDTYLLDKFSTYTNDKNNGGLSYEMEYIINGAESDKENIEAVCERLLLIRETANYIYLLNDKKKYDTVNAVAKAIALFLEMPDLEKPLTHVVLIAWAFAESCVDMRTLLDGGKVPIVKTTDTWVLSYPESLVFQAHLTDGMKKGKNAFSFDYGMYLRLLLTMESADRKVWRSINLIETNLRQTKGNESFRFDNCIEYLEIEARVSGRFNYSVSVRRYFGYMNMPMMSF